MALAVLGAGALRGVLPAQLRTGDARWLFVLVLVVLLGIIIIGDPGRIDRDSTWLRILTGSRIGHQARLRLSGDDQRRARRAGLVPQVPGLPAPVVHDRCRVQPDGRLGDPPLVQAHDDGRGGDLAGRAVLVVACAETILK